MTGDTLEDVDSVYRLVDTVNMTLTGTAVTRGRATHDRLLVAARQHLDAEGLEGLSLREIARQAGVSHGAPLRHFPTLAALLGGRRRGGVSAISTPRWTPPRPRRAQSAGGRRRLAAAAQGYVSFARTHPGVFSLMFRRDLCDTESPDYLTTGGIAFGQLVALVTAAQTDGWRPTVPATELAGVLWAAAHGLAALELHGVLGPTTGVADPDHLVRLMTDLVLEQP